MDGSDLVHGGGWRVATCSHTRAINDNGTTRVIEDHDIGKYGMIILHSLYVIIFNKSII